ncbi:MAG: nuclear transport factor 2 family protein [Pseudomonadota bacterium]
MSQNQALPGAVASHLIELEGRRRIALVARDFDTLSTLFANDLIYVHSRGNVQDKPAYLAYVQGPLSFASIERGLLEVREYGPVAVMTGAMTNTLTGPTLPAPVVVQASVVQVWRDNGAAGWQMVHFQATRLPVE